MSTRWDYIYKRWVAVNYLDDCNYYEDAVEVAKDTPKYEPRRYEPNVYAVTYKFPSILKNGKPSKIHRRCVEGPYYRLLQTCEMCSRVGTERAVRPRHAACCTWMASSYRYNSLNTECPQSPWVLCRDCWSKVRPLIVATNLLDKHEALRREVATEITIQRRKERELDKCRDKRD